VGVTYFQNQWVAPTDGQAKLALGYELVANAEGEYPLKGGYIMMFGRGYGRCLGYDFMGGFWHPMILVGVLLIVAVVIIYFSRRSTHKQDNNSVLEVLKMKYVQGEITEEEYLRRKSVLDKN